MMASLFYHDKVAVVTGAGGGKCLVAFYGNCKELRSYVDLT